MKCLHNSNIQQESKRENDLSYLRKSSWNEEYKTRMNKIRNVKLIFNTLFSFY